MENFKSNKFTFKLDNWEEAKVSEAPGTSGIERSQSLEASSIFSCGEEGASTSIQRRASAIKIKDVRVWVNKPILVARRNDPKCGSGQEMDLSSDPTLVDSPASEEPFLGRDAQEKRPVTPEEAVSYKTREWPYVPEDIEARNRRRESEAQIVGSDTEPDVGSAPDSDENSERSAGCQKPSSQKGKVKRGRGRPFSTGQYVGLAKAKREWEEAEARALKVQVEKELLGEVVQRRESRRTWAAESTGGAEMTDTSEESQLHPRRRILLKEMEDDAQTVLDVAKKSRNLKGTCVKLLKAAAESFKSSSRELATLCASSEMTALERENASLKERLAKTEREVEELRGWVRELRAGPSTPLPPAEPLPTCISQVAISSLSEKSEGEGKKETRNMPKLKGNKNDAGRTARPAENPPILPPSSKTKKTREKMEVEEVFDVGGAPSLDMITEYPTPTTSGQGIVPGMESLVAELVRRLGRMMDARFAVIEDRLLPEKRIGPPLSVDAKREAERTKGAASLPGKEAKKERKSSPAPKKREGKPQNPKKGNNVKDVATLGKESTAAPRTSAPPAVSYAEVVDRGSKDKNEKPAKKGANPPNKGGSPKVARASSTPKKGDGLSPSNRGPPKKGKKPKKTAAVTITVARNGEEAGDAVNLAQVMEEATAKVNIKELGIEYLRPRRAKTGGLILEIPGEGSAPKADRLAEKLKEALGSKEGIRISRPVTMAELRISGLDDAATAEKVAMAIATKSECSVAEIRVGDLKRTPSGLMTAWVRCPAAVARRLSEGRLQVGWVAAKVELLNSRALQCHRCLAFGHVRAACTAEEDRSDRCYRCGIGGHRAAECREAPKCQLCAAKNWAAEHRLGGLACPSSPGYKGRGGGKRNGDRKKKPPTEVKKTGGGEDSVAPKPSGKQEKGKPRQAQPSPAPKTKKGNRPALPPPEKKAGGLKMDGGLEEAMDIS